jgi:tRNA dimethylallyltransferase
LGSEYSIGAAGPDPTIAVIAGPTGVGKSAFALGLAARLGLEIVSADSRQVYRYLDVGTAKPTPEERARVRHHLADYVEPDEPYSVARYRDDGEAVLAGLAARSRAALVVGGSGHYIQALVDRIEPPRVAPQPRLRAELERLATEHGAATLHAQLAAADPQAARTIPPENIRRVVRALEVIRVTGRPFSKIGRRRREPRQALRLALTMDREALYRRADARVDGMIEAGWLDEVRALLERGYDPSLPALSSTGYCELIAHLRGELSLSDAVQRTKWATHAYIRRQYVWLRRQPGFEWIEHQPNRLKRAAALVERHLAGASGAN